MSAVGIATSKVLQGQLYEATALYTTIYGTAFLVVQDQGSLLPGMGLLTFDSSHHGANWNHELHRSTGLNR